MCDIAFIDHGRLKYVSTELEFGDEYVLHDCLLQGLVMQHVSCDVTLCYDILEGHYLCIYHCENLKAQTHYNVCL